MFVCVYDIHIYVLKGIPMYCKDIKGIQILKDLIKMFLLAHWCSSHCPSLGIPKEQGGREDCWNKVSNVINFYPE